MADKMYLIITLRKEVTDRVTGREVFDYVKQKMADKPEIIITGHVSNHFDLNTPPPPG